jgi:hypothetical protein
MVLIFHIIAKWSLPLAGPGWTVISTPREIYIFHIDLTAAGLEESIPFLWLNSEVP